MIRLMNESEKEFVFTLTKNPIINVRQSPRPTGINVDELDPSKNDYQTKKDAILKHPNYSKAETVVFKPGLNTFENDEHAEYIYMTLGNPEEAGSVPIGGGKWVGVKNENFVKEVDETGKEIKNHFYKKYRVPAGFQMVNTIDETLAILKKE